MTSVKPLHVSAPGSILIRVFVLEKGILAQPANLDTLHRPTRYTSHAPSGRGLFG